MVSAWYACDVDSHELGREPYVACTAPCISMVCNLREEVAIGVSALRLQGELSSLRVPTPTCPGTAEGEPDMQLCGSHDLHSINFNNIHLFARRQLAWSSRERAARLAVEFPGKGLKTDVRGV
jgi:hypothetical protein